MSRSSKLIGAIIADRYCITSEIGVGGMGRVYSAIPFDDPSRTVAIKVILRDRKLNYEDLLRFQKEAALMSRLHHPNIISFHELGLIEPTEATRGLSSGYYIVMEIAQGNDLKKELSSGRQDLEFFFQIGLQVSSALEYTHSKNIIHRDIKPQNIIVDSLNEEESNDLHVKVLDFGVAKLAEINQFDGARDIAGTPMYMAPETSDHLKASVDHRSDLYALGCVLYEIIAGRPPFIASSKEMLAREHAYTKPEPLMNIRPDLPEYVNDIVLKLLAKHPDDRYQTAFGLHVDLQKAKRCIKQGLEFFDVSTALARYDGLKIMTGRLDLIGRESEFSRLIDSYVSISKGRGRSRLSVLKGGAGTGKSRLLGEVRSYLAKHKIRYVSTSFSRHENNLPFNALANGLNEYLNKVLKSQPVEAEEIRSKVKALLGNTASLVAQVVPGLKPYIYDFIDDGGIEEGEREFDFSSFAKAFSDFTRCLTSDNQPIVFIFDDMHWADEKSIELVDRFFSHNNSQRFYLIVSHNDISGQHQSYFNQFITKFEKLRRRYSEITLEPLNYNAVSELTAIMLNANQSLDDDLVDYLVSKTKGNPLYLVELVRSLVVKDYFRLDETTGMWFYDTKSIKTSKILLDSIDLTLNRVLDYNSNDRYVLEVASVVGTSFHFEMLMIDDSLQSMVVMKALQRAMSDYLIVRGGDVDDLKALGKSFSFSHNRIRESIKDSIPLERRRLLHQKIALKLQRLLPQQMTQTVFTLAHHFNQALGIGQVEQQNIGIETVVLAFRYNVSAGEKAYEIRALVSAERYFRNCYELFPLLNTHQTLPMKKYVLDKLGDLLGVEKQYTQAIRFYSEFLQLDPNKLEYSNVAYKIIYYRMLNGMVSEPLSQLNHVFKRLSMSPAKQSQNMVFLGLFRHAIATIIWGNKSPIMRKLGILIRSLAGRKELSKETYHPVKLYHIGQLLALTLDSKLALRFHAQALKMCLRGHATPDAVVHTMGDFGIVLGHFGFKKYAYLIVDRCIKIAEHLHFNRTFGYLLMMRTLTLDHFHGKYEDHDSNMSEAINRMGYEYSQHLIVQSILFRMYQSLIRGKHVELSRLAKQLPVHLRTRHWLSPRGNSYYLFGLLLCDAREQIVQQRSYLRRRLEVGASKSDIFLCIMESIILFAMGDAKRSLKSYHRVLKLAVRKRKPYLFPYEQDFIALYSVFFPSLLAHEFNRYTQVYEQVKSELMKLRGRYQNKLYANRSVPLLFEARLEELSGGENVKVKYDLALKASRVSQEHIIELLTHFWFGRFLLRARKLGRKEYIYSMHKNSIKLGLSMLENIAASTLEEFGLDVPGQVSHKKASESPNQYIFSKMSKDTIAITDRVLKQDLKPVQALTMVLKLLRSHYGFKAAFLIMAEHMHEREPQPFTSEHKSPKVNRMMVDYVGSYLAVRSTLFIPEGDAPWNRGEVDQAKFDDYNYKESEFTNVEKSGNFDQTVVLDPANDDSAVQNDEIDNIGTMKASNLNTLIPIKFYNRNLGILLLEKTEIEAGDSTQRRQDLDHFGSLLGLWLRYGLIEGSTHLMPGYSYKSGRPYIEECSWLNMWAEGSLRGARESIWYLGLKLSESSYLLVYCRLNGVEEIREDISSRLWYQFLAIRTLFVAKVKKIVSWEDLYEETCRVFCSTERAKRLEGISVSFSIFDQEEETVSSGHFGPSRPLVLGQANEVIPHDKAVMTMMNGRNLRFWRISSLLTAKSIYISSHDSSKLDEVPVSALEQVSFFDSPLEKKRQTFLHYLKQVLVAGHVPRYFVAATCQQVSRHDKPLDRAE